MSKTDATREFYYDKYFGLHAAKINPGEFTATDKNIMLVTVLGSCIAVCLRDPVNHVHGMNHFLLPDAQDIPNPNMSPASYGVNAMELLINDMLKMGAERHYLEAKIFGGSNALYNDNIPNTGEKNKAFILNYMALERIPVIAQDIGGNVPRKIYFLPGTGEVKLRRLNIVKNATIIEREADYCAEITSGNLDGGFSDFGAA